MEVSDHVEKEVNMARKSGGSTSTTKQKGGKRRGRAYAVNGKRRKGQGSKYAEKVNRRTYTVTSNEEN
jgi:hypothetical protein